MINLTSGANVFPRFHSQVLGNSSLTTRQQSLASIDREMEVDINLATNSPCCCFLNLESHRSGNMMVHTDSCFPIGSGKSTLGCTDLNKGTKRAPLDCVNNSYDRIHCVPIIEKGEVGVEEGQYHLEDDDDDELSLLDDIHQKSLLQSFSDPSILPNNLNHQPSQSFRLQPLSNDYYESLDSRTHRYEQNGVLADNCHFHIGGTDRNCICTISRRRCKDCAESNTAKANLSIGNFAECGCDILKEEDLLMSYDTAEFDVADSYDPSQSQHNCLLTPLQLYSFLPVNASARETITQYSALKPENTTILDLLEQHSPPRPQAVRSYSNSHLACPPAKKNNCGNHLNNYYQKSPSEFFGVAGSVFSRVSSSVAISPPVERTLSLDPAYGGHCCEEKSSSNEWYATESSTVDHPFWFDVVETRSLKTAVLKDDEHTCESKHLHHPRSPPSRRFLDSHISNNNSINRNYEDLDGSSDEHAYTYDASELNSAAFQRSLVLSIIGGFQPIPVDPIAFRQPGSYLGKGRRKRSSLTYTQQMPLRDSFSFGAWEWQQQQLRKRQDLQGEGDPLTALSWDLLGIFEEDVNTALDVYQLLLSSFFPIDHDPNIALDSRYQKPMVDGFRVDELDDMIKNLNATRVLVVKVTPPLHTFFPS